MTRLFDSAPCVFAIAASLSPLACGGVPLPVAPDVAKGAAPSSAAAAFAHPIHSETVDYKDGATPLEGYLAYPTDGDAAAKYPAILVFHDWMGVSADTKRRADMVAELGYVALAADVYGKGVRPGSPDEAMKLVVKYKGDRPLMRARGQAALARLVSDTHVDASKVVAVGYCFGGTEALELARSGSALAGVVSFHGGLDTPHPDDAKSIKARILALHGADDPYVKPSDVAAFEDEMRNAKIDWELKAYGGAVHAFTVKGAGDDPSKGAAYNAKADARSWTDMRAFLGELWGH